MPTLLEQFVLLAIDIDSAETYIPPSIASVLRRIGFTPHRSYLRPPRPPQPIRLPCPGMTIAKTPCKNKCAPGRTTCMIHSETPPLREVPLPDKRCTEIVAGEQCKCPKFKNYSMCWRHAKRAKLLPPPPEMPSECSICYSEFTPESTVKTTCGHFFHVGCFDGWKQSRLVTNQCINCPMCRRTNPKPRLVGAGTARQNSQANVLVL
jgi:hypothetical protein